MLPAGLASGHILTMIDLMCYINDMAIDTPLTPHLEQFIREQLATGRFQSEDEVIRTALHLLEEQSHFQEPPTDWLKQELDKGLGSRPGEPVTKEFWEQLRNRVRAATVPGNEA
jgi:antitoxin ParD1/3/4